MSHNRAYVNRGLSSCAQHANKMFPCRKHELPSIGGIFTGHSCRPGHTWVSFSHPVRYSGPRRRRRQSYTTLLSHFRDSRQRGKHTKASRTRTRTHIHTVSRDGPSSLYCFSSMNRHFPFLRSLLVRYFYRLTLAPRGAAMFPLRLFNKIFARIEIDDREFSRRL